MSTKLDEIDPSEFIMSITSPVADVTGQTAAREYVKWRNDFELIKYLYIYMAKIQNYIS